jgi:hypothetical protein
MGWKKLWHFETIQYALCHRKFSYMINQKFMKLCTLQDPNMKMCTLVVYPGQSSFPRIMSLNCPLCGTNYSSVPIILIEPKHIWNTTFRLIILGKLDWPGYTTNVHIFILGSCKSLFWCTMFLLLYPPQT